MREYGAVCDHLHERHPELDDDGLYDKARLVISALIAKIHTAEWTPRSSPTRWSTLCTATGGA
jgi:hypothetical protein